MRRLALSLLAATLLALFLPLLLRDRVVFPHDNTIEVGLSVDGGLGPPSNRRYSDASHYYLPAVAHQLRGDRAGWIASWDPHVELGKPAIQTYGLGKAFLPLHVLSWISDDPLRVYTWSALLAVALASLFGFLLLDALGLHPFASLTGALGIGVGSLVMYALCFTLFLWGVCWTAALFWCTTLFVRRPSAWSGFGLAFSTHALLLSGYPQFIVWQAYLLGAYALLGLVRHAGRGKRVLVRGAALVACVSVGALSALPVYWDLLEDARRSTRLAFDPEFFARILPDVGTWSACAAVSASLFDAFAFGNPAAPDFPHQQAEPFLLPFWSALAAAGMVFVPWRRSWPILAATGVALALTVWEDAYVLAVRTLGFGLSRSVPIRLVHLPLIVLAALAADRVLRGASQTRRAWSALAAIFVVLVVIAVGPALAEPPRTRGSLVFAVLLVLGSAVFVLARKPWLLALLALASALYYGLQLRVSRGHDEVRLESPLTEFVRAETQGGARFAWAGANVGDYLAPNQEALYGLRSIHSYNPLFASAYQEWAARYRQTQVRGTHDRRFLSVIRLEDYLRESAALAATTLLVSGFEQSAAGLSGARTFGPIRTYRVGLPPILQLQTRAFERVGAGAVRMPVPLGSVTPCERTLDRDERLAFRLGPTDGETLLFVSQQYHPRWRARGAGRPLETVSVNGIFQGVLVPPGTREVELSYQAAVHWSWIPQAAFFLTALCLSVLPPLRARYRARLAAEK